MLFPCSQESFIISRFTILLHLCTTTLFYLISGISCMQIIDQENKDEISPGGGGYSLM